MNLCLPLLIVYYYIIVINCHESESEGAGDGKDVDQAITLYNFDEPIYQVDHSNFTTLIYNQPRAYFIEFYSSWCGGCIKYAPTYKKFARKVKDWKDIVTIGAVNCAREDNRDLCQHHGIDAFPTLKYFKSHSSKKSDGKKFEGEHYDIEKLAANLAYLVAKEQTSLVPRGWPSFEVLNQFSDSIIDKYFVGKVEHLIVMVEKEKHNIGNQIILDMWSYKNVEVVLAPQSHLLVKGIDNLLEPGLIIYSKGHLNAQPVFQSKSSMNHEEILETIRKTILVDSKPQITQNLLPKQNSVNNQLKAPEMVDRSIQYQLHLSDIMTTLSYMIRHEIGLKSSFNEVQLPALQKFFDLLTKYFPGRPPVRRFLLRLNEWLQIQKAPIDGREWNEKVAQLQAELGRPLPTNNHWVTCKGSDPKWRGYPCGLWNIFHAITVAAYKAEAKNPGFSPRNVLESVHGYVRNFFGCKECSDNFEKSAIRISLEANNPQDAVLWLWKSHNRANKFLKGTASEDTSFPKQQFPPVELCRQCYIDPTKSHSTEPIDVNWNEAQVLKYLIHFYSDIKSLDTKEPYDIVSFDSNGKIHKTSEHNLDLNAKYAHLGEDLKADEESRKRLDAQRMKENLRNMYNWGERRELNKETHFGTFLNWTGLDTSLCLFLWFASSFIVVGVFCYMKWRRNSYRYLKTFSSDYGKYRV